MRDKKVPHSFDLKKDKDVERWCKDMARGSIATADNYLRVLHRFCEEHKTTPKRILSMNDKDRYNMLSDHIDKLLSEKKAPSYVGIYYKVVKSWLAWNDKTLGKKIRIRDTSRRPTLENIPIPSQDMLRKVLNIANARERTAIAFIAFAGLRPEVLGTYKGTDGITLKDIPDLKVEGKEITFTQTPAMIRVPERLSKTGHRYFTFLGPEGCEYLSAYLQERMTLGENIGPDSPVITRREYRSKDFITTTKVSSLIRKPMRRAGVSGPPYFWRSYFAIGCMSAERKGLSESWKTFFMGHKGTMEAVYTTNKQLPSDKIEEMRKGYEAALQYLETIPKASKDESAREIISFLLIDKGFSEEEIEKMELGEKSKAELVEILKKGPKAEFKQNGNHVQKVISIQDLPRALDEGWEYKATLPDGRAIVENGYQNGDNGRIPFREK